ncbi:MAG: DUF362 domain-containing protein [Deltaproteobacteria bacterium]|nr:DUF362 domain-containing protein [Deltaproteobacteria bacterium]
MNSFMNRRDFLTYQLKGLLWIGVSGIVWPARGLAADIPDIAVATGGTPEAETRAVIEMLGGIGAFVKNGDRVLIKPNMSFAVPPERASNTHPKVVSTLAALCKEAGASRVMILDNPLASEERCLEASGIYDACKPIDEQMVQMVNNSALFQEIDIPGAVTLKKTDVMKDVLKADVFIAAPVAKSHSGAGVSLSMKGMMGLIYNRRIMHMLDLHTAIVDLASVLKPDLTVIDATRVLSTGGPGGPGKVLKKDTVIASRDMVAADAYAVSAFEWYGKRFKPRQVRHIREAHERKLGRMDVENLAVQTVRM